MTKIPHFLIPHFRTNHAGETGAVYIYKGILLVSRDKEIINFSQKHLETEVSHLQIIEDILLKKYRSKLIFLWKIFGFLTGFIPSLLGKKFIYATIFAVESFVEIHYQEQIQLILKKEKHSNLKKIIQKLKNDEVEHKEEALKKLDDFSFFHVLWKKIVTNGSMIAVKVSKVI